MTRKGIMIGAALLCGASFLAGHVLAQEGEPMGGAPPMPEWAKLTKEHADFAKMKGTWDVKTKMWMKPGQPPTDGTAVATSDVILGGRFVSEVFKGNFMGEDFEGHALLGFDTIDKEYVSVWVDSMSPIVYVSRGTGADGNITFKGKEPDWMTGKKKNTQMVIEHKSDDEHISKFYDVGADEALTQTMELHYTRRKE